MDQSRAKITRHARRRMRWRKISEKEVREVLSAPDKTQDSIRGRTNVYKKLGDRYIKVTFRKTGDEIFVISAVDKGRSGEI